MLKVAIALSKSEALKKLRIFLSRCPEMQVIWGARDGSETVERVLRSSPDILLIGVDDGSLKPLDVIRKIMKQKPCAILLLTSDTSLSSSMIFQAMGAGAVDAVCIPTYATELNPDQEKLLIRKMSIVANATGKGDCLPVVPLDHPIEKRIAVPPLLLMGASTGGPSGIVSVIKQLSTLSEIAVVVIQHINEQFTTSLAGWLKEQTGKGVELIESGIVPQKGKIYLAGQNSHLVMSPKQQLSYFDLSNPTSYTPSIDVFFESVAESWPEQGVAVLLSGMGVDGARGLRALRNKGWYTIAEHRNTCIVYGMPKAAAEMDAAKDILELHCIAQAIDAKLMKEVAR